MKKIDMPFSDIFDDYLVSGMKICTTRSRRYGDIGDYFLLKDTGIRFKIINVSRVRLSDVIDNLYMEEGFKSKSDFMDFWLTIHRELNLERRYYLHTFVKVWQEETEKTEKKE